MWRDETGGTSKTGKEGGEEGGDSRNDGDGRDGRNSGNGGDGGDGGDGGESTHGISSFEQQGRFRPAECPPIGGCFRQADVKLTLTIPFNSVSSGKIQ
ncbi:hypothetical protein B5G09_06910 [Alistipes sp. An54]|nr:hypothetical protein B5G09_06910 [Alistipes sp. An54]